MSSKDTSEVEIIARSNEERGVVGAAWDMVKNAVKGAAINTAAGVAGGAVIGGATGYFAGSEFTETAKEAIDRTITQTPEGSAHSALGGAFTVVGGTNAAIEQSGISGFLTATGTGLGATAGAIVGGTGGAIAGATTGAIKGAWTQRIHEERLAKLQRAPGAPEVG